MKGGSASSLEGANAKTPAQTSSARRSLQCFHTQSAKGKEGKKNHRLLHAAFGKSIKGITPTRGSQKKKNKSDATFCTWPPGERSLSTSPTRTARLRARKNRFDPEEVREIKERKAKAKGKT